MKTTRNSWQKSIRWNRNIIELNTIHSRHHSLNFCKLMQIHGFHEGLNLAREIELFFPIVSSGNIRTSHLKGWVWEKQKQRFNWVQFSFFKETIGRLLFLYFHWWGIKLCSITEWQYTILSLSLSLCHSSSRNLNYLPI